MGDGYFDFTVTKEMLEKDNVGNQRGDLMDNDRVKGKLDDMEGRAKRQVGEWTGDTEKQVEGTAQQVKGKVENAWGKAKDAVRDADDQAKGKNEENRELDRERNKER